MPGILNGMGSTVDAAGRIVIPKGMRDRLGLDGGQRIEIVEREGHLEIAPATTPMLLEKRRGVPVAVPEEDPLLTLSKADSKRLPREAVAAEVTGGSIYDALVAATARRAGATLLTRDRRAVPVYEAMGAEFDLVS